MKTNSALSLALAVVSSYLTFVDCFTSQDADAMYNGYNKAFLHLQPGNMAYYQQSVSNTNPDDQYNRWRASLELYPAEDVFRRTGSAYTQTLVGWLVNGWLASTPQPWDGDGWNDDLAWYTLGLIRGYQVTGNFTFLGVTMNGSDYVFARGWDTTSNNGGIWELQPTTSTTQKEALSNSPNAQVACLIYQSTHIPKFLDRCKTIYDWEYKTLFNATTGAVYHGVFQDGTVDKGIIPYNQGNFIDTANLLWLITGDTNYYKAAKLAVDYGFQLTDSNGIFDQYSTDSSIAGYADDFARGAGNFMHDNSLWDTYYDKFVLNANAILKNRRTDLNLTWNAWDHPTDTSDRGTTQYASAVSWLQYIPNTKPASTQPDGARTITNQQTNLLIESVGSWQTGQKVDLSSNINAQWQRWLFTLSEEDGSYIMVNLNSFLALTADDSGASSLSQSLSLRNSNQRWLLVKQSSGNWRITNKATGLVLDGGSSTSNGAPLTQTSWTGAASQQWALKGL